MDFQQLAHRTAEAAAGIRKLIVESGQQASSGAALVDAVGHRLELITAQIAQTSDLAEAISQRNADQTGVLNNLHAMVRQSNDQTRQAADRVSVSRRMAMALQKLDCDMAVSQIQDGAYPVARDYHAIGVAQDFSARAS